jgi:hypothetical protein
MKILTTLFFLSLPISVFAQFGVGYYQGGLPFVALSYGFKSGLRPEARFGSDNYLNNLGIEGVLNYNIIKNDNLEFYAGLGARANVFPGMVIPIGVNFYPLPQKQFGLHIEVAPIFSTESGGKDILRGSWGIHYRFIKQE